MATLLLSENHATAWLQCAVMKTPPPLPYCRSSHTTAPESATGTQPGKKEKCKAVAPQQRN